MLFDCSDCKKKYEKEFNEDVARRFESNYRLCDKDINKFCLILRKGVYLYGYIDSCQIFNEKSLPDKKEFYRNLNMEDIKNADYKNAKKLWEDFKTKNLGEYHDLYLQSNILLPANVLENFRNKCIEICEFDPAHYLSAPGLARKACLKMTNIILESLTDIDMLQMVEKGIRGGNFT